ncbi:MAG: pilin N-terminal domain-containing protein [Lachnospiraceae bacterium]|nr:pilin N-terminal domain-containing protein [Lachnospiraceae bacterium]
MKKWIHLALLPILVFCMGQEVLAAQPDLEPRTDSLTVKCVVTDEEEETLLSGVGLTVTKVADAACEDGNVTYTLTDAYADLGIDFTGITASESNKIAKQLAELQDTKGILSDVKVSGTDGIVVFTDLEHGIYLVRQMSSTGMAEEYSSYAPFLVMLPEPKDGGWNYSVEVYPKTSVKKVSTPPPPKKTTPPGRSTGNKVKTGDDTQVTQWSMMMIGAFMIIAAILVRGRRRE